MPQVNKLLLPVLAAVLVSLLVLVIHQHSVAKDLRTSLDGLRADIEAQNELRRRVEIDRAEHSKNLAELADLEKKLKAQQEESATAVGMNVPAVRETLQDQVAYIPIADARRRARVQGAYSSFMTHLRLSDAQKKELTRLLAAREEISDIISQSSRAKGVRLTVAEREQLMHEASAGILADMESLLGKDGYQSLEEYTQAFNNYGGMAVNLEAGAADAGMPITAEQKYWLMHELNTLQWDPSNSTTDQRIFEDAAAFLSNQQLNLLRDFLDYERSRQLAMNAILHKPSGGAPTSK